MIELPAQQASINVTLAGKDYTFCYDQPDSVCGIAHAARNTAVLWSIFAAILVAMLVCICSWQRCKPGPQGGLFSHWRVPTVLMRDKLSCGKQVAHRMWFLVSDVGWTIYDQVTDAITVHSGVSFSTQGLRLHPFGHSAGSFCDQCLPLWSDLALGSVKTRLPGRSFGTPGRCFPDWALASSPPVFRTGACSGCS